MFKSRDRCFSCYYYKLGMWGEYEEEKKNGLDEWMDEWMIKSYRSITRIVMEFGDGE